MFASFINVLSTSLQSSGLQDFFKCLLPKLSATRTLRLCRSLCLRQLREIICFHLRALPLSVCLLYVVGLLYHSIFRKNHIYYQSYQQHVHYISVALCAFGTSVILSLCFHLRVLPFSVCLLYGSSAIWSDTF